MKQLIPALFAVGAVMALIGAAVFITGWVYAPYIYTIGAGFVALAQVNTPLQAKSKTLRRLRIQQIFGALALILTGAFMFTTRGNEWIACLDYRSHTGVIHGIPYSTGRRKRTFQIEFVFR